MVSLLARSPRRGWADAEAGRSITLGWLAVAAGVAVSAVGLAGLTLAVVVVQTLDPAGGLPLPGSMALAGRLWLLAQGGELDLASGPLVLAPLLLTAGILWGLSSAGRWVVRARDVTGAAPAVRAAAMLAAVHAALTVLLAVLLDSADAGVGLVRTTAGAALAAAVAAGWGAGRESGAVDDLLDRLPGPTRPLLRGIAAGSLTALGLCTVVVAVAVAADAEGYAAISGALGGAGAGALGLVGLGLLLLPNAAAAV